MNVIRILASQPWVERLGMTLLHSVWEGAVIVVAYGAARGHGARKWGPNGRYLLACAALATMTIGAAATFLLLRQPSPQSVAATFAAPMSAARTRPAPSLPSPLTLLADGAMAEPFLTWVVALWLAGASAFALRLFGAWMLAERLRSSRVRPASAEWQQRFDRLKARVSLSQAVRLLVSGRLQAPAAIGWLRPVVLMPAGALTGMPTAQIEAILLHELAHLRRYDYLAHILQSAIEAVFFYHPAVWWISSHMRTERELCCDDIAVSVSGDAAVYVRALAEFDSARWLQPVMAANGGSLADRIARLLDQPPARRNSSGSGIALLLILLTTGMAAVFAQSTVRPEFEAASVKPSTARSMGNVRALPGRLTADASPLIMVQYAYGVQPFQIVGGPEWLRSERYRIEATAGGNANRDRTFLMLQSLLESRFQLKTHRETRELPVYALVAARSGVKLPAPKPSDCVESAADAAAEWAGERMAAPGEAAPAAALCGSAALNLGPTGARLQGAKVAMPELVRRLSLMLDRSLIDKTGFTQLFDLRLDFVPDEITAAMPPPPPDSGISGLSLPQALREQLGLQLESTKGPVEVIVIDRAERPSGN